MAGELRGSPEKIAEVFLAEQIIVRIKKDS